MLRTLSLFLACLTISPILLPTAGAQSVSGLVVVQAEPLNPAVDLTTQPTVPRTQLQLAIGSAKGDKTPPPEPATSDDQVSVTLRTAKDSYAADVSWLDDVKRFLKYSRELREWNRRKDATQLKLQREKQAAAGDTFLSLYEHLPTQAEIEAEIGPPPAAVPMPKVLDLGLVLDIKNLSDEPIPVNVGLYSDVASVSTTIRGPGAMKYVSPPRITTMEIRIGNTITLGPGETKSVRMNMTDGQRGFGGPWFFTEPGDHEVVMKVDTTVDGRKVSLETNRVPFKIVATPQQG